MEFALTLLAVIGVLACLRLMAATGFWLLRRGLEGFLAREIGDAHARRGDLSALSATEAVHVAARRDRRRASLQFGLVLALLLVPPFTPWTRLLYAAWSPLWLLFVRRPM